MSIELGLAISANLIALVALVRTRKVGKHEDILKDSEA